MWWTNESFSGLPGVPEKTFSFAAYALLLKESFLWDTWNRTTWRGKTGLLWGPSRVKVKLINLATPPCWFVFTSFLFFRL